MITDFRLLWWVVTHVVSWAIRNWVSGKTWFWAEWRGGNQVFLTQDYINFGGQTAKRRDLEIAATENRAFLYLHLTHHLPNPILAACLPKIKSTKLSKMPS